MTRRNLSPDPAAAAAAPEPTAERLSPEAERSGLVARVAALAVDHRRLVALAWIVILIGVLALSGAVGGASYSTNFSLPGTESQRVIDLLKRDFPAQSGDSDQIVLRASSGSVGDPAVRARVVPMLASVARLPHVSEVVSPYGASGTRAISSDGRIAFATVRFDERANLVPRAAIQRVIGVAQAARAPGLQVELGGQAIEQAQRVSLGAATGIGVAAAIIVLLLTFGSFLAMGLPLVTALLGLGTGVGLIAIGSHVIAMPNFSTELAVMIGLGVGIDYSLFIVTRFRESLNSGQDVRTAIIAAMDTAGRAVLFAGCTVIIALLGMFALGVSFLYGLAIAASLGVLMTMFAALTILPALLGRFGARVGRHRRRARRRAVARANAVEAGGGAVATATQPLGRGWARWAALVQRRPWPAALAGVAIMLVLAAPALSLRLGSSDAGNDPATLTTRRAYDLLARGFGPGFNGPLQVVASLPSAASAAALTQLPAALRAVPDVASVSTARLSPGGRTAVLSVYPRSAPQAAATATLVSQLRSSVLPPIARASGATLLVGGVTAAQADFSRVLSAKLPLFIGIVVVLSALLLLVVFRSLVIPLQAAVMNLLSIAASLGVVVAIFQHGWLGGVFNVKSGPIDAFIPVLLFAIVFGLSMDYEVFLVSRIHEEWERRRDASRAVADGMASTGRVITAAATIMICVFLSFVLGDERVLKLFGLSLASAVFLDAFVVRSLLLPAVLELLGRRAWVMPHWLGRRLPRLAVESRPVDSRPLVGRVAVSEDAG